MRSTETAGTTDESFDYWAWYFGTDNSIRKWDEEHGVHMVRNPNNGMPGFVADKDILFADTKMPETYPEYFKDRLLERFALALYTYGKNRDMAKAAFDKTRKYILNFDKIMLEYSGGGLYYFSKERGTGKTFLSTILGNELSRLGYLVRWYSMTNLLQEIKSGYDRDSSTSSSQVINCARNATLLILDDIGVEKQSAWVNETVYTILDYRMSTCKPTVFTSNHRPEELSYDERIIDRITRMTELIPLPEESIRRKLNSQNRLGSFLES